VSVSITTHKLMLFNYWDETDVLVQTINLIMLLFISKSYYNYRCSYT